MVTQALSLAAPHHKRVAAAVAVVSRQQIPRPWAALGLQGMAWEWYLGLCMKAFGVIQALFNSHFHPTAASAGDKSLPALLSGQLPPLTFWVCSFHGSFCSSSSMLLGRNVRTSCMVILCIGLLPSKAVAGPLAPFSRCHGNQLALRPRRSGNSWSAHTITAAANISSKKSKAC